jgi:bacteriorhodopsin
VRERETSSPRVWRALSPLTPLTPLSRSAVWPLYTFSTACMLVIMVSLIVHLRAIHQSHSGTAESKAFNFLAVWTIVLWSSYPILFVLSKTHVMDYDAESIIFCILDVLAKCESETTGPGRAAARSSHHPLRRPLPSPYTPQASLAASSSAPARPSRASGPPWP